METIGRYVYYEEIFIFSMHSSLFCSVKEQSSFEMRPWRSLIFTEILRCICPST